MMSADTETTTAPAIERPPTRAVRGDDDAALRRRRAAALLHGAALLVTGTIVLGQLLFAGYVAGFYGHAAWLGRPELWNRVLPHGYVAGATLLNGVLAVHLVFAVALVVAGALQLTPALRRRAPRLHRWIGRGYLIAAALSSVGGLAMVWGRGSAGNLPQHLGISLNAVVILGCAATAWRRARAARFDAHRRWALRLFLAVSGVWFFRVGLMAWIVVNQGPLGFDPDTFTGPFLSALSFAQYLLPLALLELVFRAQRAGDPRALRAVAATLGLAAVVLVVGTAAATALMWLPPLRAAFAETPAADAAGAATR